MFFIQKLFIYLWVNQRYYERKRRVKTQLVCRYIKIAMYMLVNVCMYVSLGTLVPNSMDLQEKINKVKK